MQLQFFPWLFDDKNAWEKSLADPRYSYDLPMDSFMSIYQIERKVSGTATYALPALSKGTMPMPVAAPVQTYATSPFNTSVAAAATAATASAPAKEEKKEGGILSQDEIDALLSGI